MAGTSGPSRNAGSSPDVDPDLADLLGASESTPDFNELFDTGETQKKSDAARSDDQPLGSTEKRFEKIEPAFGDPHEFFSSANYYKQILTGEGDISKRIHGLLGSFLKAEDPQDRSMYRGKLGPAIWELVSGIATQAGSHLGLEKRLFQRFHLLLPTMINPDQRELLARVPVKNRTGEPVFYVDEWLEQVGSGRVNQSATDETKLHARSQNEKLNSRLEKTRGRRQAQEQLIRNKLEELRSNEQRLTQLVREITTHETRSDMEDLILPYTDAQKSNFSDVSSIMRRMSNLGRELERDYRDLDSLLDELKELSEQSEDSEDVFESMDTKAAAAEVGTVRQMAKLCVGRQGNHFPLVYKQYFKASSFDIGTRENVINILADVERLDPELFHRTFKQQTNRIIPNVILIPCYGDTGVCWEPFERLNRATSRGRLAIPMYPKDLKVAVITACADLRWQVAKEKAAHYWMEEGLTGWYYQWFSEHKMKGDVKDKFIEDYVLWISKESEGTQKLDREVRSIFWRYIPFPQDLRDTLKNRGFVYQELYKKDQNRAISDGY
ncbi:MAG: hypothetical protein EA383_11675 [Spirochaetaceae bacterium]|nr:MAG: hypothetical protein EA383_11675 [Spirochaetaceae bacterium]